MHDLFSARDIFSIASKAVSEKDLKKVDEMVIELGKIEDHGEIVKPENLRFHLKNLSVGTPFAKCKITIRRTNKTGCLKLKEIKGRK